VSRRACGTIFSARCIITCSFLCLVVACHSVNNISVDEGMEVFPCPSFSFSSTESCTRISAGILMQIIFQSHSGETVADIPHEIHVMRDRDKSFVHRLMDMQQRVLSGVAFWTIVSVLEQYVVHFRAGYDRSSDDLQSFCDQVHYNRILHFSWGVQNPLTDVGFNRDFYR